MRLTTAAFILIGMAAPMAAFPQTISPELQALIGQSMEQSQTVRQGILQEQATRLRTEDAKSGYLPSANATAGYTYLTPVSQASFQLDPTKPAALLKFVPNHNYSTQVNVSQTLLDFGRTRNAIEAALEEEANARTTTESFRHLLSYQVAQVYYGVVFLQQSIAVQDTILASLGENARTIDVKIRQGEAIDLDRLNTQSQIDQARNRKIDLQNQLAKQMASLTYLAGPLSRG